MWITKQKKNLKIMNKQFLANETLYLRALEPEDLTELYEIENDPSLWDVSNITVPYSKFVLRQYIEATQSDMFADRQLRLMIVRYSDHKLLGTSFILCMPEDK